MLVNLYRKPCKCALNTSTCGLAGLLRYLGILSWNSHAPVPHTCNSGIESHAHVFTPSTYDPRDIVILSHT